MYTLVEKIIPHLGSWLMGAATIIVALAQLTKARTAQSKSVAKKASTSAKRAAGEQEAPEARPPTTWRKESWRAVRLDLLQLANSCVLLVLTARQPTVTPLVVVLAAMSSGLFFFSIGSAVYSMERLRRRWLESPEDFILPPSA